MKQQVLMVAFCLLCFPGAVKADFFWQPTNDPESIVLWRSASSNVLSGISLGYSILARIELRGELGEFVDAAISRFESAESEYQRLLNSEVSDLELNIEDLAEEREFEVTTAIRVFEESGYESPSTVGDVLNVAIKETTRAAEFLSSIRDRVTFTLEDQAVFDELIELNSRLSQLGEASGLFLRSLSI